jgi:hypothetical protein
MEGYAMALRFLTEKGDWYNRNHLNNFSDTILTFIISYSNTNHNPQIGSFLFLISSPIA